MKIYFYTISNGEYSDYGYTSIYHDNKFTNKEFTKMYNEAIEMSGGECQFHDQVAEKMAELFGFTIVDDEFEICREYDNHKPIPLEDISEEEKYYSSDSLY